MQVQVDSWIGEYGAFWNDPRVNMAKLVLCLVAGCSDIIILTQFYVIYPKASRNGVSERLLS